MKTIQLTKGYEAIVDDELYEFLNKHKWYAKVKRNNVYAERSWELKCKKYHQKMHRLILNISDANIHVDHINHNGLDNRKENLRLCTNHENRLNTRSRKGATSNYVGVSLVKAKKRGKERLYWLSRISFKNKKISKLFPYSKEGELWLLKIMTQGQKKSLESLLI